MDAVAGGRRHALVYSVLDDKLVRKVAHGAQDRSHSPPAAPDLKLWLATGCFGGRLREGWSARRERQYGEGGASAAGGGV